MAGINRSIVQNNSNYSIDRDTRSNTRLYTIGILLLYAGSFKLDIFGSDSIKISAAMLPRDKCCTKITVAADLVPKVQYILPGPANTPKRCTYYSDTIARTTNAPAGYCVNQIAFRLAPVTLSAKFRPSSFLSHSVIPRVCPLRIRPANSFFIFIRMEFDRNSCVSAIRCE